MKLRLARKIAKTIGTPDCRYSEGMQEKALDRLDKCKSEKALHDFWNGLMDELGVEGRAKVLAGSGAPGMAFNLLMRSDEIEWDNPNYS